MTAAHIVNPALIREMEFALDILARPVVIDPVVLPIFERADRELTAARAAVALRTETDAVEKARALVRIRKEAAG